MSEPVCVFINMFREIISIEPGKLDCVLAADGVGYIARHNCTDTTCRRGGRVTCYRQGSHFKILHCAACERCILDGIPRSVSTVRELVGWLGQGNLLREHPALPTSPPFETRVMFGQPRSA